MRGERGERREREEARERQITGEDLHPGGVAGGRVSGFWSGESSEGVGSGDSYCQVGISVK